MENVTVSSSSLTVKLSGNSRYDLGLNHDSQCSEGLAVTGHESDNRDQIFSSP